MPNLMRAAGAALVASVLAVSAPHAQARPQAQPATLPPMRAQPPVRRPPAQATPAQRPAAQRPAAPPASTRPRTAPATPAATTAPAAPTAPAGTAPEKWEDISVQTANAGTYRLPVGRGHAGPSVLHVQVLLNRAFFSAGMLDGRWGRNTQNAVTWLQAREGLPATGMVDSVTYARLAQLAGEGPTVRQVVLTAGDVAGPFVQIPADIYAHARLRCSCYESLTEKLTESFQTHADLLRRLNPGVKLDSVTAGTVLNVPQVRDTAAAPPGIVKQIVVSGRGNYLQALDSAGRILYHFAATLGSTIDPSPDGDFRVTSIHPDPWWNYQPKLLAHVPDDRPNALIPPGPNNAVGKVWMSLSAPHYGIHGTKSPETIGYAESAGCVRLTNWDVTFLSGRVAPGTPVTFRDTRGTTTTPGPQQPAVPAAARPDTARPAAPDTAHPRPASPRPATSAPASPRPASTPTTAADTSHRQPSASTPRPAASGTHADSVHRAQPAAAPPRPTAPAPRPAAADTARTRPRG